MQIAFGTLFTLMALPADSPKIDLWGRFAEPQLKSGGPVASYEETYNNLDAKMRADPRTAAYALDLTAQEFLDRVNPRLPAAYAAPNNPLNAPYVLFSAPPGQIPRSAPVVELATRLELFQIVLMTELYGRIFAELHPVQVPAQPTQTHSLASLGGGSEGCKEACQSFFGACETSCSQVFVEDLGRAAARFRADAGPELILLVGAMFAITALSDTLVHGCGDNQECINGVHELFEDVLVLLFQNYNTALSSFTGGYYEEIEAAQSSFGGCRQSCNQTLAQCLVDCHNQGGG